jgi:hypothetical protein
MKVTPAEAREIVALIKLIPLTDWTGGSETPKYSSTPVWSFCAAVKEVKVTLSFRSWDEWQSGSGDWNPSGTEASLILDDLPVEGPFEFRCEIESLGRILRDRFVSKYAAERAAKLQAELAEYRKLHPGEVPISAKDRVMNKLGITAVTTDKAVEILDSQARKPRSSGFLGRLFGKQNSRSGFEPSAHAPKPGSQLPGGGVAPLPGTKISRGGGLDVGPLPGADTRDIIFRTPGGQIISSTQDEPGSIP